MRLQITASNKRRKINMNEAHKREEERNEKQLGIVLANLKAIYHAFSMSAT